MDMLIERAKFYARSFGIMDSFLGANAFETGVHAAYRQLDARWGLKIFAYKKMRDETFRIHTELFHRGAGPEVCKRFKVKNYDGMLVYGYIMEHIPYIGWGDIDDERYDELEELASYHYQFGDLHSGNVGRTADGRHLIIDCSFYDNNVEYDYERNALKYKSNHRTLVSLIEW